MSAAARFTWELRTSIPVLYTHQKTKRRRVLREGSLRIVAGRAILQDAEGRALDEQTVTLALLDQLENAEEIDFPGHLVQPDGPVAIRKSSTVPAAGVTPPPPRSPSPRVQRLRQPFKRPRLAANLEPDPLGEGNSPGNPSCGSDLLDSLQPTVAETQDPSARAPSPLPPRRAVEAEPPSQPPGDPVNERDAALQASALDLWDRVAVEEDEEVHGRTQDLWEGAAASLRWQLLCEGFQEPSFQDSTAPTPPSQPLPTPCRANVSPTVVMDHGSAADGGVNQEPVAKPAASSPPDLVPGSLADAEVHHGASAFPSAEPMPSPSKDEHSGPDDGSQEPPEDAELEPPEAAEEEVSEDDLPLIDVVGEPPAVPPAPGSESKRAGDLPDAERRPQRHSKSAVKMPPTMRLPLQFIPHASMTPLSEGAGYCDYFEHALLTEMQRNLSQVCSSWQRSVKEAEVAVAVKGARMGRAKEDPTAVALLLGRNPSILQGEVKACAKNDLWIILMKNSAPLLLRSVWKGVNPSGRVLCVPVNDVAANWLESTASRLVTVTALASGAFASELLQVEALRSLRDEKSDPSSRAFAQLLGALPVKQAVEAAKVDPDLMPEVAEAPELASLSPEQREVAIRLSRWALQQGPSPGPVLVRGVFGSGKSRTLAACIVSLDRLLRARRDPRRILLVCQTNVAVDAVLHYLLSQFGWDDFARLGSFRSVDPELLYRTVSLMASRQAAAKELSEALQRRPPEVRQALQSAVDRGVLPPKASAWRRRRLVAATTAALEAAELGTDAVRCPLVLVDEATQLTEPAILYALQKACAEEVLLMGDPRQLPPRVMHAPLQISALERLWDSSKDRCLELATQFRCHPTIADMCSRLFYNGLLKSGITAQDRSSGLGPAAAPLAVVLSEGPETRVGQSYRHDAEAKLCASWLQRAAGCGRLQAKDFGVICLYRPHAEACSRLAHSICKDVEVATVDAFQGGEKEAIALCCGRSSPVGQGDPFACCPRRLNVALSRARRHLVVFGTERFLSQHPTLSHVLAAAASRGAVHRAAEVIA